MTDVPTLTSATVANYAVMNPLDAQGTATLSDANLTLASSTTAHKNRKATFVIPSTGKWYWELTTASTCSASVILGWGLQTTAAATDSQAGNADTFMAQNDANQDIYNQTTNVFSGGSAVAANAIRQVAYDADTGKLWFGINNVWYSSTDLTSGNPSAGTNQCMTLSAGSYFPTITCYNLTANVNFGQQPLTYTPPTGFVRLNTFNLTTPTIGATAATLANEYMDVLTWTGNGASSRAITGLNFQPDWVWDTMRSDSYQHAIVDSVRGGNPVLHSNSTSAEDTNWQYGYVSSFDSNGFTIQAGSTSSENWNLNAATFVAWNWNAGGSTVTNTTGSISSQVRASTTAGFSIVTYTGTGANATVGHGLGVAPSWIITRYRGVESWAVYHKSTGNTQYLTLNTTSAAASASTVWQNTSPTSTVFSVGTAGLVNTSGGSGMVAYCFAEVAGYSAFGSYTGNGSTDGPFVFTGFRPRYVMTKRSDAVESWRIGDAARSPYNAVVLELFANLSNAEENNSNPIDYLSNGFKIRTSSSSHNASGGTYIYMVFAETPQKFALGR